MTQNFDEFIEEAYQIYRKESLNYKPSHEIEPQQIREEDMPKKFNSLLEHSPDFIIFKKAFTAVCRWHYLRIIEGR